MVNRMADEKKNPLAATGEQLRTNLKRIREARRLSYRELSDRLTELGRPIPTLGLSRIEKGERRVDADDLMALCVALGVNPGALLLPPVADNTPAEVTAIGRVPSWKAWMWMDGREPIKQPYDDDDLADFQLFARPKGRRRYHRPGERTAEQLAARRADVVAIAKRLYPDSIEDQEALIQRERELDPEAWAGD